MPVNMGDCEDGAILTNELARMAGIPSIQREIRCGKVTGGGHAYFVYTSDSNGIEYEQDWCYWYDNTLIPKRVPLSKKKNYLTTWFGFNEEWSYKRLRNPNEVFKK